MSSIELEAALKSIDPARLAEARKGFMSIPKSFTIRRGKVAGKEQLEDRLRRAIAAYQAGTAT